MRLRIMVRGMPLLTFLKGLPAFLRDYAAIRKQAASGDFPFGRFYPCFEERNTQSGNAGGHYFHQDLLVASRVFQNNPVRHVDIGSRIDGLVAHIASFRVLEVLDIRDLKSPCPNIRFQRADLMQTDFPLLDYCDSISCLHALEHFGLGRYGDRIDYRGHLRGWENLHGMLRTGGRLYFSVPMGEQRIEFNAHRVFSLSYLLQMIKGRYRLDAFSYVNDTGELIQDPEMTPDNIKENFFCHYGCAIFELVKL